MCRINQAALLFIQLLVMCHVFAENHRSTFVFRGGSVTLTCNISNKNETQISWTNGRSVFQYSVVLNCTFSNFSFYKLNINHELPTELTIFSAQPEDEGLYTCAITGKNGLHSITWNLTVSEKPTESISKYCLSILSPAIGFILCGIVLAVFLCRKIMMKKRNQGPVCSEIPPESEELELHQPQGHTAHWKNNKRRSQYMENLNAIYDHF
ncbi:unnamed protein product [Oreochromis niloticus]|nr:unnamed protein product [Mustela putorius furo]